MELSTLDFFVTVGRGTETFAESEIRNKFSKRGSLLDLQVHDGKIVFQLSDTDTKSESYVEEILTLRCVERAFVAITEYVNDAHGKRDFLNQLMGRMSANRNYEPAKKVLEQLSSVLHQRKKRSQQSNNLSCNEEPPRKVARMHNVSSSTDAEQSPELQSHAGHGMIEESKEIELGDLSQDDEKVLKTFRMCVKCSGKSSRWIILKKLSKDVSWRISKATNWIVDLRHQDFEVCLHISDHHIFAGIPLTKKPLSRRPFILDPGLRAPVAWIMVQLAEVQSGDVILDPMCGKGTLLLEACSCMRNIYCVGGDMDATQINVALQNIKSVGFDKSIDLLQVDSLCLPLESTSVSVIVCDAPFNQKYFTSKKADEFYASFLQEMHRVLKKDGRFVLLTSRALSEMIVPWLETDVHVSPSLTGPSGLLETDVDVSPSLTGPSGLLETDVDVSPSLTGPSGLLETDADVSPSLTGPSGLLETDVDVSPSLTGPSGLLKTDVDVSPSLTGPSGLLSQKSHNSDSDLTKLTESNECNQSPVTVTQKFLFKFVAKHYMKLGETHADIIVMTKL